MKKIINHLVLHGFDIAMISSEVRKHIDQGWQPIGGVAVTRSEGGASFYQAMVLYEED